MTRTAQLLTESRQAHKGGREAIKRGNRAASLGPFRVALDARLAARKADPDYTDPSWTGDLTALHSLKELDRDLGRVRHIPEDEAEPGGYSQPSARSVALLRQVNTDLEAYYRQQLGEAVNPSSQVDLKSADAVVVPTAWVETQAGVSGFDPNDGSLLVCRHVWDYVSQQHRRCVGCGCHHELRETMAREDTEAYRQLVKKGRRT